MLSSRQARRMRSAISPRLAISTFSSMLSCLLWCSGNDEQGLVVFDRLFVVDQNGADGAAVLGLDLVEHLHGLDDAQRFAGTHRITDVDERLRVRRRRAVERTDHRCA